MPLLNACKDGAEALTVLILIEGWGGKEEEKVRGTEAALI